MKNNAMHYKMYKAKKNIVFAGLATTAALAGLTFANVNNTANADTVAEPAVAATSAATASAATTSNASDSAAIQQAQSDVASTSANVQSQTAVVNSASNALASAQQVNSASTAVSDAEVAYNSANSAWYAASEQAESATNESYKAAAAVKSAQGYVKVWNGGFEKTYNEVNAKLTSAQAAYSDAQAQLPTLTDQWNKASEAYDSVMSNPSAQPSDKSGATIAKQTAYNNLMSARDIIKNNKPAYYQNVLDGKAVYGGGTHNYNYVKAQVDALPSLEEAANVAHQNYLNALAAKKAAGDVANAKWNAWAAAREAYNLPNSDELARMQTEANGASKAIANDNKQIANLSTSDAGTNYSSAQQYASDAAVKQGQAQNEVNSAQAALESANQKLADFQKKLDAAQSAYDQNSNDLNKALLKHAQDAVDLYNKEVVKPAQNALKTAQAKLDHETEQVNYWNGIVKDVQNSADYIKYSNDIAYRQGIIDHYNQAKENLAAAKDAAAAVAPLQAKYDAAVQLLNAYTEQYNQAKAKLEALLNGQKPDNPGSDNPGSSSTPDSSANPGSSSTPDSSANPGSSSTPDSSATPGSSSTPDSNVTSDSTSNSDVNNGSNNGSAVNPGANNGNSAVNGGATVNNGSVANNNGSVAGNTTAVDLGNNTQAVLPAASANTSAKSEAASDASAASLPQTGNENAGAIVALGAVSAMFGLGLAAKKREF